MVAEITADIIQPEPDALSFTVHGVPYTATETLTVARHRILQRLQTELAFDVNIPGLMQQVNEAWAALEAGKIGSGALAVGKLREALNHIGTNRLREVEICALFYNAPGEDPAAYDFQQMQAKVQAWGAVDRDFFTRAALRLLQLTSTRYPLPGAATAPPTAP